MPASQNENQNPGPVQPGRGKLLICLPTYNERENLERLLKRIFEEVEWAEVLVIDDNSPDGTGDIADRLARADDRIKVRHRTGKLGLGTAYAEGFSWAMQQGYELVFSMDCDFSHDPKYLPDFIKAIENCDLVVGSRYVPGGATVNWGFHRRWLSAGANALARFLTGIKHHDFTTGYRLFRRRLISGLDWSRIRSEGYAFFIEILYHAHAGGYKITEIPIVFVDRQFGKSKIPKRTIIEDFYLVLRLRLDRIIHRKKRIT